MKSILKLCLTIWFDQLFEWLKGDSDFHQVNFGSNHICLFLLLGRHDLCDKILSHMVWISKLQHNIDQLQIVFSTFPYYIIIVICNIRWSTFCGV